MQDVLQIERYVRRRFPGFGLNKRHAVIRLLYEISRRDNLLFTMILPESVVRSGDFVQVRSFLLARRYPSLTRAEWERVPPLTTLPFLPDAAAHADCRPGLRNPQTVFYEEDVSGCDLLRRLRVMFPRARFESITNYADFVRSQNFTIQDYNRRWQTFFLVKERYDRYLECPCSRPSRSCGYHIMNAGMGCAFECAYCYLQGYVNAPGIQLPGNLDEILEEFSRYYQPGMRLGTGQFTDSLIFDHWTGFSRKIIATMQNFPYADFEFKTKSSCIENILATPPADNIIVSWSVNPQGVIDSAEFLTASLQERLSAASRCAQRGYRVGFHFDPIIFYQGWEGDYRAVIKDIFQSVAPESIAWISLGCLRMTVKMRQVMEQRFPESPLLFSEQILGFDGKLRYPPRLRRSAYEYLCDVIRSLGPDVCVYLCMEDDAMNDQLKIPKLKAVRH